MLEIKNLSVKGSHRNILENLSFSLPTGSFCAVVGRSGVGKSTLLNAIAGKLFQSEGSIHWKDRRLKDLGEVHIPGIREVLLVDQDTEIQRFSTIQDSLESKFYLREAHEIQQRTDELCKAFELEGIRFQSTEEISGGQQQRLAIAMSLCQAPELLLLDEPFNQQDLISVANINSFLDQEVVSKKMTVMIACHRFRDISNKCSHVLYLPENTPPILYTKNEIEILKDKVLLEILG